MFQYATGRSLAERLGVEFVLDTSWTVAAGGQDRYELECFGLDARACPVWEVARVPNRSRLVYALQRLRPRRRPFVHPLDEELSTNAFMPAVLTAPDNTYLRGYWQFEDYFIDHEAHVRRAFTFPPLSPESENVAETIRRTPAVSVHVRRGDYIRHDNLGFLDSAYYARATEAIEGTVGRISPFVFSDDPHWCAQNLDLTGEVTIVDRRVADGRDWEDMCLMSICRHHVIANSTYSWWGAWLNPSPSKIVVAPKTWVRGARRVGDPVPKRWIRV